MIWTFSRKSALVAWGHSSWKLWKYSTSVCRQLDYHVTFYFAYIICPLIFGSFFMWIASYFHDFGIFVEVFVIFDVTFSKVRTLASCQKVLKVMKICITQWVTTKTRSALSLSGSVPAIIHWPFSSGEEPISARDSYATSFSKNKAENERVTLDDSQVSFSREENKPKFTTKSTIKRKAWKKWTH